MTIIEDILSMTFLSTKISEKGKVGKSIAELKERAGELPPRYVPELKCWTEKGRGPVDCTEDLCLEDLKALESFFSRRVRERINSNVQPSSTGTK